MPIPKPHPHDAAALQAHQYRPSKPALGDPRPSEHAADWLRHIDAGTIPTNPGTTPAQFLTHLRNEEVLLGRPRSLQFATPAPYQEQRR